MSDRLFGRAVRVVVGTHLIEGMRVVFKVKKTVSKDPNECDLTIYNLAESTRAALQSKGTKFIVEAGYGTTVSQIFAGDSRFIDHVREGPDWLTRIQCGDGERAYRYAHVSESFKPGTPVSEVFAVVARATGLDVTDATTFVRALLAEQFTQGYSAFGKASAELDRLLKGRGLEWSIQDGRLQVLPEGKPAGETAVFLSPDTGLIGSPAHGSPENAGKNGQPPKKPQVLKVKSLLQPSIRAGGKIQVDSAGTKGVFRVQTVTHVGDTFGGDFYSECECLPVS